MKAELSQAEVEFTERDFFAEPFTADELQRLIGERTIADYFSWRSPAFRKLGLARADMTDSQMLKLMAEEPRLIRRPLVLTADGDLIIGTDKDALSSILR